MHDRIAHDDCTVLLGEPEMRLDDRFGEEDAGVRIEHPDHVIERREGGIPLVQGAGGEHLVRQAVRFDAAERTGHECAPLGTDHETTRSQKERCARRLTLQLGPERVRALHERDVDRILEVRLANHASAPVT